MSANEASGERSARVEPQTARACRLEAAVVLASAVCVLVLAWILRPSPAGFGTHEQIFVLPCAFRWLTSLPCPVCGMTTAFSLMARGEVMTAFSAHALGPLLYISTWLLAANAAVALVRGRGPIPRWVLGPRGAKVLLASIGAAWLVNTVAQLQGL
jgi:hypothetical protein